MERLEREEIIVAARHLKAPGFGKVVRLQGRPDSPIANGAVVAADGLITSVGASQSRAARGDERERAAVGGDSPAFRE